LTWLALVRGRAPLTIDAYQKDLRCFAGFARAAGLSLSRITHSEIETYLSWLQTLGGRAPTTATRRLHALRSFFKYLAREGVVDRDPAVLAFGPKVRPRLPTYLAVREQEAVLTTLARDASLRGRRDYALLGVALLAGLRVAELATLPLAAVRFDAEVVHVVGKGQKAREVPLVPRLAAILTRYCTETRPALAGPETLPWLFLRIRGHGARPAGPVTTRALWRIIHDRVSPLVGRSVHPHTLRHSFASRLRAAGVDVQTIQQCLGHQSIVTTLDHYAHIPPESHRDALARALEESGAKEAP
jgi:integrase/recombinase XerD